VRRRAIRDRCAVPAPSGGPGRRRRGRGVDPVPRDGCL